MIYFRYFIAILCALLFCSSVYADNLAYVRQMGEPLTANIGCQIVQIGDNNLIKGTREIYAQITDAGSVVSYNGYLPPTYQGGGSSVLNDFVTVQTGNSNAINLVQWGYSYNDAYIDQDGSRNILVKAGRDPEDPGKAIVDESQSAAQIITSTYGGGFNELTVEQNGNNNSIGLYQSSHNHNIAEFHQMGDYNQSAICQINSGSGYNSIFVDQNDGDRGAMIYQETSIGNNEVYYVSP